MMGLSEYITHEERAMLTAALGTEVLLPSVPERDMMGKEEYDIYSTLVTGTHVWHKLWLFGLIEDQDVVKQRSCGDLWRPYGRIANGYYVPDDEDTEISIFNPPEGVHDARPIN